MAEAFNKIAPTTLIVPLKPKSSRDRTYSRYNIISRFKIIFMPSIDLVPLNLGIFFFYLQSITFSLLATVYSLFLKKDVYYTRDIFSAFFLVMFRFIHKKKVIYEIHGEPTHFENKIVPWTMKHLDGCIVLNSYILDYYKNLSNNIIIAPDAVDLEMFNKKEDKSLLRKKLNMLDKKLVLYSGHLYKWKGIYTLIDSAKYLTDKFHIYLLGGTSEDIKKVKQYIAANRINNVTVLGFVEYKNVPDYLASSDILVLPNSMEHKQSSTYTSPLKLFEYMASGNVIVSANVPSSREILNKDNSIMVAPDDPKALAEGIKKAANKSSHKLALKAKEEVVNYSWDLRAKKILDFFSK
jgi:glycosyltransferase involved in cell wall biosynthesis